ncbi:neural cell adhesion molecule L1-like protein [Arapaima gigas]
MVHPGDRVGAALWLLGDSWEVLVLLPAGPNGPVRHLAPLSHAAAEKSKVSRSPLLSWSREDLTVEVATCRRPVTLIMRNMKWSQLTGLPRAASTFPFSPDLSFSAKGHLLGSSFCFSLVFFSAVCFHVLSMDIPLEVEQPPTITHHSPRVSVASPLDDNYTLKCTARGNPEPEFRWTKNGRRFDLSQDSGLIKEDNAGSFTIPNGNNITQFGGSYRCYASNRLGTAVSEEIEFIVPSSPKFPKETIDPIEVEEGQPVTLQCNPPSGIPPRMIYWMTIGLKHIQQDQRVSTGLNGDLYFSNTVEGDTRTDYCCFASFLTIRTIVQKTAMALVVRSRRNDTAFSLRKPSLMTPPGVQTEVHLVKGEDLQLECIAEGLPTPVVNWTKYGEEVPDHSITNYGKRLVIPGVSEDDGGTYTCMATNSAGHTTHTFLVTVEEPPHWLVKPESQLKTTGSDVELRCSAAGRPKPKVTWMLNGQPLQESPAFRGQLLKNTVVLHHVKPNDSGVYQCLASNIHGTLLVNVNVMVLDLAPLILTEARQKYEAVMGTTALMPCRVFSSPPSNITWARGDSVDSLSDEKFSVQKDGSLYIHAVQKEDAGEYTCFSINSEGNASISATLDIKDATKIVEPPQNLRVARGSTAEFVCRASYDKSLTQSFEMLWEKDEEEISLNQYPRHFAKGNILQISNTSRADQGTYKCVVRTSLDQVLASALLIVLDVPDAPEDLELYNHENLTVILKWVPGEDHNSTITEFIVEYEESQWEPGTWRELKRVPGNQTQALLDLHGHLDYQFRVSAVSAIGRGAPSRPTEKYITPAAAPDRNPDNVKSEGNLPHEMIIRWEPLLPVEHNGPGLEYKVSYRQQGVEDAWQEYMVKRHSIVVKNTPTYVPYDVKVRAANELGWAPEPPVHTVYSGEDLPAAAPANVAVTVLNSNKIHVSWTPVPVHHVQGLLGGYKVQISRLWDLLNSGKPLKEKETALVSGNVSHTTVLDLVPFSEYNLTVAVFNGRGMGPRSHPVTFKTPEGVPEKISILRATNAQSDTITLVWSPPLKAHGVLRGYLLQYQMVNDTAELENLHNVSVPGSDSTQWVFRDLESISRYRFYVSACTRVGCGPPTSEESETTPEGSAVKSESPNHWLIGSMCAAVALTLVALVACFVRRSIGGKYSVKEKDDARSDLQSQGKANNTSSEYSDSEEKPLQASLSSIGPDSEEDSGGMGSTGSEDEDGHFSEDGSFIGEYAGRGGAASADANGAAVAPQ